MSQPVKIDFVSDVVCPWCAIGLQALEQAIARIGGDLQVELRFQPFELNPQMRPEGEDVIEHLTRKYGMSAEQARSNGEAIRQRGEALGFTFDMDRRRRMVNTFDAHRLLHWAGQEGLGPVRSAWTRRARGNASTRSTASARCRRWCSTTAISSRAGNRSMCSSRHCASFPGSRPEAGAAFRRLPGS